MLNGCKFSFQISCMSYLDHFYSLVFLFSLMYVFHFDLFWYPKCWLRGHAVISFTISDVYDARHSDLSFTYLLLSDLSLTVDFSFYILVDNKIACILTAIARASRARYWLDKTLCLLPRPIPGPWHRAAPMGRSRSRLVRI